jgi:hypothetical protein
MARLVLPLVLLSALCFLRCKPTVLDPRQEAPGVYRAALDRIIAEYLMGRCVSEPYAGFSEETYNNYRTGKIDSSTYAEIWDSLFTIRKNQLPNVSWSSIRFSARLSTQANMICDAL